MVDPIRFGEIIKPLEQRFKKLMPEQQKVYYDRLRYSSEASLEDAVNTLVDKAKLFPTPGELKEALREANYNRLKNGKSVAKSDGCPQCHDGYVFYEKLNHGSMTMYVGDCAYCHKGETSIQAQVIQRDNGIYWACERFMDGRTERFRANPDIQEPYHEASPVKTDQELKDRFLNV